MNLGLNRLGDNLTTMLISNISILFSLYIYYKKHKVEGDSGPILNPVVVTLSHGYKILNLACYQVYMF